MKPSVSIFLTRLNSAADRLMFNWPVRESLYKHLAAQVSNGIAIEIALDSYQLRLERNKKISSQMIVRSISKKMRNGSTFSNAIANWIPQDELSIISSGELSGDLPKSLTLAVEAKRRMIRINKVMKSAMSSPLIYAIMVYALLWGIGGYVTPGLQQTLPKESASGTIYMLYVAGDIANSWWVIIPPLLVITIIYIINKSLPRWTGKYRIKAEKYFPYSFYRDINGYKWLMGFVALLQAGMPDVEILKRQAKNSTPWMKERLDELGHRMINGKSLSAALLHSGKNGMKPFGFPNPDIIDDIASFSGFDDFSERISLVAQQWSEELESKTMERAKFYGFVLEIFMYGVMGFLMIAINSMSTQMGNVPGL